MANKVIVITTDNVVEVKELPDTNFEHYKDIIGGWVEPVRPAYGVVKLPKDICFVCDEEGHPKGLPINYIGTKLYDRSGRYFIAGPIIITKEGWTNEGRDFISMTDDDVKEVLCIIQKLSPENIKQKL